MNKLFQRGFHGGLLVLLSFSSLWVIALTSHLIGFRSYEGQAFWVEGESRRALVFFGYMGCGTACPPMFAEMSQLPNDIELDVIFVAVQPPGLPMDKKAALTFGQSLHPQIQVVLATTKQVEELWLPTFFKAMPYSDRDWIHGQKAFYLEKEGATWHVQRKLLPQQIHELGRGIQHDS